MTNLRAKIFGTVLGLIFSGAASAFWVTTEVDFCPASSKVMGHCEAHLASTDLYNFVGGNTMACYLTKNGIPMSDQYAEVRFEDGNTVTPIGEVITTERHIFPFVTPIGPQEYCAVLDLTFFYRFLWSESLNYVVKEFELDSSGVPSVTNCNNHEGGGGGNPN